MGTSDITHQAIWEVSTAKTGTSVKNLIDTRLDTFWQSNSGVPHFITGYFNYRRNICAVELYVHYGIDDTYTPKIVVVRVGDHVDCLETVGEFTLSAPIGWVKLRLEPMYYLSKVIQQLPDTPEAALASTLMRESSRQGFSCSIIQIGILANFQNGQDSHVRQVKVLEQC
ncbi:anaphase-promoting complex subunit 10 [Gregarina niphandrodes]|uniref:Anaphase-promoting complex subunit 10 n=1 Tax=Gregarina niphandrodes TaxID=110365 RepID=A0A023B1H8_GRENI|nr:anaphase-promoting complex subunit 10 [Gregarina niphandrodes]EZG46755.1 anaphase-promoting complex subunit 10 [Gregarina niphandrodes]|eukprot:XP_011132264.1 anaphase-promoting complex subunit 10 [Gregarina niphandrodes]